MLSQESRMRDLGFLRGGALALLLMLWNGCATRHDCCQPDARAQVQTRLMEILRAAETKDFARLDSYHWYGPHFTKFAGPGPRQDAETARAGEHRGLSALTGLKLHADDLKIEVFQETAVATFTLVATLAVPGGTNAASPPATPITKRERGTLVFAWHEGGWKIVHEHFSAAE